MKLGIIVDSSCGLTKKEAEDKGWIYLPLYMTIDGKDYADGVDITPKEYYDMIDVKMDVKTSATPPAIIEEEIKKASEKYEHVIVYALSKELSSQTNNITIFSQDFKNVHVLPSKGVGYGIVSNCLQLEKFAETHDSIDEILKLANELIDSLWGFAVPETMDWLVKGGRASSGAASLANMLKIVPIIEFKDGKLEKGGKGRVFKKTVIKASKNLKEKVEGENVEFVFLSAGNKDAEELAKIIGQEINEDIKVVNFPPVIGNHIGKGAVALLSINK